METLEGRALRDAAVAGGTEARLAFERFWVAYYKPLSAFAASYRGLLPAHRDDAVADALIEAFRGLSRYDPGRPLSPWVYGIAAKRFSDAARAARRSPTFAVGDPAESDTAYEPVAPGDIAAEVSARDLAERCRLAIAGLPEMDRRIAMLRFYEDMNAAEIGVVLGMPAGTVRWRLHLVRRAVAEAVGEGV